MGDFMLKQQSLAQNQNQNSGISQQHRKSVFRSNKAVPKELETMLMYFSRTLEGIMETDESLLLFSMIHYFRL